MSSENNHHLTIHTDQLSSPYPQILGELVVKAILDQMIKQKLYVQVSEFMNTLPETHPDRQRLNELGVLIAHSHDSLRGLEPFMTKEIHKYVQNRVKLLSLHPCTRDIECFSPVGLE
ncbi:MAG: hypothetical protein KAT16_05195 [Candidatus Heimdallarchaeota archaeon]|nr:hypothetical protein [Candidatus Heimdallarchaeota archaeon]